MNNKKCRICQTVKSIDSFHVNRKKKDGRQSECKACKKNRAKVYYLSNKVLYRERTERYREELKKWLADYKKELKCKQCPETHPACLHFHHLNRKTKIFSVSRMVMSCYSKCDIIKEIEKCEVLCANCHAKLHYNEYHVGVTET